MATSEPQSSTARRSGVRVLPVAVGGCGACAASARALLAPRYAARLGEQGISFTETPRHADVVLMTGALTIREREAAQAYVNSVPQPRVLVAVGNCAIDGCVFAGSPYLTAGAAEALNAHVEIGGCPPEPEAILAAIVQAAHLLADADASVDDDEDDGDASAGDEGAGATTDDDDDEEEEGREV